MSNYLDTRIRSFLSQKVFALAGASRSGESYGCKVMRHLLDKGYEVLPVHPVAEMLEGVPCAPSLVAIHKAVDGLILVVPPEESELLVRQADIIGIRRIWMQPGAESEDALAYCDERCLDVVAGGPCLLVLA